MASLPVADSIPLGTLLTAPFMPVGPVSAMILLTPVIPVALVAPIAGSLLRVAWFVLSSGTEALS